MEYLGSAEQSQIWPVVKALFWRRMTSAEGSKFPVNPGAMSAHREALNDGWSHIWTIGSNGVKPNKHKQKKQLNIAVLCNIHCAYVINWNNLYNLCTRVI